METSLGDSGLPADKDQYAKSTYISITTQLLDGDISQYEAVGMLLVVAVNLLDPDASYD